MDSDAMGTFGRHRQGIVHAVAYVALSALASACAGAPVTRTGPPQTHDVSSVYPGSLEVVRGALLSQFHNSVTPPPAPYTSMAATALDTWSPDWSATYVDPGGFLDDYRKLSAADRGRDLLLQDSGDNYWLSEYATAAGAVKFHCGLIVHYAAEAGGTRVSVFELTPTVWVGEKWAMSAHAIGPARVHDLRFVEPTVTDRQHLLAWIDTLVR